MADAGEGQLANLHLDEVTGERVRSVSVRYHSLGSDRRLISKSELKKRQKQRQLEEKKREKAAAAPPTAAKKSAEELENDLTPNVKLTHRRQAIPKR